MGAENCVKVTVVRYELGKLRHKWSIVRKGTKLHRRIIIDTTRLV